ncbi:MAG: hypothetical protein V2A78_06640 [bacterium]
MGYEIEEIRAVEAKKSTQATSSASATEKKSAKGGELDAGKSTVKGDCDYFDGRSVITDADTVVDIASIMNDKKASNMKPEALAAALKEKGYDVTVVKMGNRKAVQFKNGDYFVDSDGDGNLGTKDQNFQNALGKVEQNFGINLTELKESKYTRYHKYSEIGKGTNASSDVHSVDSADSAQSVNSLNSLNSLDRQNSLKGQDGDIQKIFSNLDSEMAARGYNGEKKSSDLWQEGKLSSVLQQLGISEPSLPDPSEAAVQRGLNLFGAAFDIAEQNEETL